MKRSDKESCGTSFYNDVITASKQWLTEILGEPDWTCNDIEDKVQNEWICETEEGDVFTIYDWKEYREYGDNEMIEWHIGAHNGTVADKARMEVEMLLNGSIL